MAVVEEVRADGEAIRPGRRKIEILAEDWGFDSVLAMLEESTCDSVSPGICMNPGCTYSTSVEPDCFNGHCESCGTMSVMSALAICGII